MTVHWVGTCRCAAVRVYMANVTACNCSSRHTSYVTGTPAQARAYLTVSLLTDSVMLLHAFHYAYAENNVQSLFLALHDVAARAQVNNITVTIHRYYWTCAPVDRFITELAALCWTYLCLFHCLAELSYWWWGCAFNCMTIYRYTRLHVYLHLYVRRLKRHRYHSMHA